MNIADQGAAHAWYAMVGFLEGIKSTRQNGLLHEEDFDQGFWFAVGLVKPPIGDLAGETEPQDVKPVEDVSRETYEVVATVHSGGNVTFYGSPMTVTQEPAGTQTQHTAVYYPPNVVDNGGFWTPPQQIQL